MEYSYNGEILTIYINKYDKETKSSGASLDGKEIETIKLPEEEISIQIKKIMAKGDKRLVMLHTGIVLQSFIK